MADVEVMGHDGVVRKYRDMGDGTYAEVVYSGGEADGAKLDQTLLSACGSAAGAGNNTIVAAPGAGAIYVYGYALQATGGAVNAYLRDGAAGSALCQTWNFGTREGISRQVTPPGYLFKLTATTLLALNLSGAVACGWEIQYWVA